MSQRCLYVRAPEGSRSSCICSNPLEVTAEERGTDISLPLQRRCEPDSGPWALKKPCQLLTHLSRSWWSIGVPLVSFLCLWLRLDSSLACRRMRFILRALTYWQLFETMQTGNVSLSGEQGPFLVQQTIYHWNLCICVVVISLWYINLLYHSKLQSSMHTFQF